MNQVIGCMAESGEPIERIIDVAKKLTKQVGKSK